MTPVSSPTELTSAVTDLLLGLIALVAAGAVLRTRGRAPVRAGIWGGMFLLLAGASLLGSAVHGVEIDRGVKDGIWAAIYLALGFVVALFLSGAVLDRWGERAARRALPWVLLAAVAFFAVTRVARGTFLVFIAYEATAMLFALGVYGGLVRRRGAPGAGWIAAGIAASIAAAAIQSARGIVVTVVWPFDHNGLFHVVQAAGVVLLARGLTVPRRGGTGARASPIVAIAGGAMLGAVLAGPSARAAEPGGDPRAEAGTQEGLGASDRYLESPYAVGASLGLPQLISLTGERRVASVIRLQANLGSVGVATTGSVRALVLPDRWRFQPYLFAGLGFLEVLVSDDDWEGFTPLGWLGYGVRLRVSRTVVFGEIGFLPALDDEHAGDELIGLAGGVLVAIGR